MSEPKNTNENTVTTDEAKNFMKRGNVIREAKIAREKEKAREADPVYKAQMKAEEKARQEYEKTPEYIKKQKAYEESKATKDKAKAEAKKAEAEAKKKSEEEAATLAKAEAEAKKKSEEEVATLAKAEAEEKAKVRSDLLKTEAKEAYAMTSKEIKEEKEKTASQNQLEKKKNEELLEEEKISKKKQDEQEEALRINQLKKEEADRLVEYKKLEAEKIKAEKIKKKSDQKEALRINKESIDKKLEAQMKKNIESGKKRHVSTIKSALNGIQKEKLEREQENLDKTLLDAHRIGFKQAQEDAIKEDEQKKRMELEKAIEKATLYGKSKLEANKIIVSKARTNPNGSRKGRNRNVQFSKNDFNHVISNLVEKKEKSAEEKKIELESSNERVNKIFEKIPNPSLKLLYASIDLETKGDRELFFTEIQKRVDALQTPNTDESLKAFVELILCLYVKIKGVLPDITMERISLENMKPLQKLEYFEVNRERTNREIPELLHKMIQSF